MSETTKTRCPLCGAPVVVQIAEDGPFYDGPNCRPTRIRYEYDEPTPPPVTYMGYEHNELRFVAELLRKHNVRPEDLRDLIGDFKKIAGIMNRERAIIEKNIMAEALGRFNPVNMPELLKKVGECSRAATQRMKDLTEAIKEEANE